MSCSTKAVTLILKQAQNIHIFKFTGALTYSQYDIAKFQNKIQQHCQVAIKCR